MVCSSLDRHFNATLFFSFHLFHLKYRKLKRLKGWKKKDCYIKKKDLPHVTHFLICKSSPHTVSLCQRLYWFCFPGSRHPGRGKGDQVRKKSWQYLIPAASRPHRRLSVMQSSSLLLDTKVFIPLLSHLDSSSTRISVKGNLFKHWSDVKLLPS